MIEFLVSQNISVSLSYKKLDASLTITILSSYKAELKTITPDNGKEFAYHQELAKALEIKYYFVNPYASWERGLSVNIQMG